MSGTTIALEKSTEVLQDAMRDINEQVYLAIVSG